MFSLLKRLRLHCFVAVLLSGVLMGTMVGAITNVIDGLISPLFFGPTFYYPVGSSSWLARFLYWNSLWQGLWEGFRLGLIVGLLYTLFVFVASISACPFKRAVSYLPRMAAVALVFWVAGGTNAVAIGTMFPGFVFVGLTQPERLGFLWFNGSLYGAYLGSVVALFAGCTWFLNDWRRSKGASKEPLK